jgi:hypothetical protein
MGAATSFLDKFTGDSENEKKMRDRGRLVYKECESENQLYYDSILHSNMESHKVLPITAILYRRFYIKVVLNTDSQKLASGGLNSFIGNVANSHIADAIGGILQTAVSALLSNKNMSYSKKIGYSLSIGKLGGVERLDFMMTNRTYQSKGWTEKMENIMAGVFVVSSVDVTKLKNNDATVLVQNCFKSESLLIQANIKQLLMIALDSRLPPRDVRDKQRPIIEELKKLYGEVKPQPEVKPEVKPEVTPKTEETKKTHIYPDSDSDSDQEEGRYGRHGRHSQYHSHQDEYHHNERGDHHHHDRRDNHHHQHHEDYERRDHHHHHEGHENHHHHEHERHDNHHHHEHERHDNNHHHHEHERHDNNHHHHDHERLETQGEEHLKNGGLFSGMGQDFEELFLRATMAEASAGKFGGLEKYMEDIKKKGHRLDYEKGALLSTSLLFYGTHHWKKGDFAKAAYGVWQAWRFNPENLNCNMILEKIGIFVPINLEDVTVKLTLFSLRHKDHHHHVHIDHAHALAHTQLKPVPIHSK